VQQCFAKKSTKKNKNKKKTKKKNTKRLAKKKKKGIKKYSTPLPKALQPVMGDVARLGAASDYHDYHAALFLSADVHSIRRVDAPDADTRSFLQRAAGHGDPRRPPLVALPLRPRWFTPHLNMLTTVLVFVTSILYVVVSSMVFFIADINTEG
jgi:hypothetical protein